MSMSASHLLTLAWACEGGAVGWAIVALRRARVLRQRGVVSGDVEWLAEVVPPSAANDNHAVWPDTRGPWPTISER